jgi:hypothetical protein
MRGSLQYGIHDDGVMTPLLPPPEHEFTAAPRVYATRWWIAAVWAWFGLVSAFACAHSRLD